MGVFGKKKEAETVFGPALAAVLPAHPKPWYLTPHLLKLNLLLLVPLLSSASVGYDGSMMNGLQTLPQWRQFFGNPEGAILGLMNAVYPLGKVVALFVVTYVGDRWGRKLPLSIGLVACIAFAVLQGLAQGLPSFVTARALLGFFTTFISQPSPIIITELAYPTQRGKVTALYNTFFYFGSIFAAWCTFGTFKIASTWSWRIPSLLQGAVPLFQLLGLYFLPESPRWLMRRGRKEEARRIFANYHAGGDLNDPLVEFEMREVELTLGEEAEALSQSSWLELVRTPANRKRTLIAVILGFFSQWNGVAVVSYYLTLVLNTIGITEVKDQTLINGLLQIFNWIISTCLGALMVDRLGRRPLFLISTAGMLASYIAWTGLTSHFVASRDEATGRAVVAFIFIFYFFYDIAWTPLLQAYPVEIFPYTLRGRGLSITYVSAFTGLIIGNQVNPIAMKSIAWKYYIVFCCILGALFGLIWFLFPETKGHTLEEIREVFEGKPVGKTVDIEGGDDEDGKKDGNVKQIELA
ncbi:lactose permease [Colletotrichum higginsianum]|uniref:Lactose permease n=2 Tax=Colletotrichum higginsianum TaxID=80884 RepID=H1VV99_COLHI|nr:Lactose permease [Colletotrichum higginsianum IMI 349063]OBR14747.1 Lactose permease [Colletotrichum higginsianum IMI 349063]TID02014.1 Lactose permease [Colletotrichum higginsianum]CCF44158.1 lactose permease [Colletotrichum higginsianum]